VTRTVVGQQDPVDAKQASDRDCRHALASRKATVSRLHPASPFHRLLKLPPVPNPRCELCEEGTRSPLTRASRSLLLSSVAVHKAMSFALFDVCHADAGHEAVGLSASLQVVRKTHRGDPIKRLDGHQNRSLDDCTCMSSQQQALRCGPRFHSSMFTS
jgi:hypothetical protein